MIRYADIIDNDIVNGEGICVSIWMCGCPHKCENCHNKELWDDKMLKKECYYPFVDKISKMLNKNGIERNLSILGGEPLSEENIQTTNVIGEWFKVNYPNRKLFLWTGYTLEELKNKGNDFTKYFNYADIIIDGRFEKDKRDIRLPLRGSSNQRILKKDIDF